MTNIIKSYKQAIRERNALNITGRNIIEKNCIFTNSKYNGNKKSIKYS